MQKISPFLWFDGKAEEAVKFYTSIFGNSIIKTENRIPLGDPAGTIMYTATFVIEGQEFMALDGGPMFKFSQAISFFVKCETQAEIDHYWNKLIDGGAEQQCGWLIDKFGVSWQIVPTILGQLLDGKDAAKSRNAMNAMMLMKKFDIETLKKAYNN